jgi:hypothetical protein
MRGQVKGGGAVYGPTRKKFSVPPAHAHFSQCQHRSHNECKTKARKDFGVIDGIV